MELCDAAVKAIETLKTAGFGAWVVGGCVRDSLMGIDAHDADLCTSARPEQVALVFKNCRVIDTGIKHGTVTVIIDGEAVEITTLRAETGYADHRRPDSVVFITDLKEDLKRRDFTVNAMATDGGELVDLFGGRDDIRRKIIRCVGEPRRRFSEDALRILRALRFAAKLDFTMEADTAAAAFELRDTLKTVSRERIQAELSALLTAPAAGRIVGKYGPILEATVPGAAFDTEAAKRLDSVPPRLELRLSALLLYTASPDDVLRELRFSNAVCDAVRGILSAASEPLPRDIPQARRFLSRFGAQSSEDAFILRKAMGEDTGAAEKLCREVVRKNDCISLRQLKINGHDLAKLGIMGSEAGKMLHKILDAVMDGLIENEEEALIKYTEREKDNAE